MSQYKYRNIMETLVEKEVSRQIGKLPPQVANYLRPVEIITYALNRLPALYACSERGLEQQLKKGKQEQVPQIVQAVRWAITAVQKDPLRKFVPYKQEDQEQILSELRTLLNDDSINLDNLPQAVERALATIGYGETMNAKDDTNHIKSALTWQDYKKRYRNHPPQIYYPRNQ